MSFNQPFFLFFIPLLCILFFLYFYRKRKTIILPSVNFSIESSKNLRIILIKVWPYVFFFALGLILIGAASPQFIDSKETITKEGLDITIALDISQSMLIEDLAPNRLEVAKSVAIDFVNGRSTDRIAMVVFAEEGYVQCPLTNDYAMLIGLIKEIRAGITSEGNATAIGSALAVSLNRLRGKETKKSSKLIILITDGESNAGEIDPMQAAEMAQALGIRIYTIGVGRQGPVRIPVQSVFGTYYQNVQVKIDEKLLMQIAEKTEGRYYRAEDKDTLGKIFQDITKLEKSRVAANVPQKLQDISFWFLLPGLLLLLLHLFLERTYLKRLP